MQSPATGAGFGAESADGRVRPVVAPLRGSHLLILLVLALAIRATFLLLTDSPDTGDWQVYARVAANILRGCGVSLSDPAAPDCLPHFGGNGLPGYPAFIAAVWTVIGPGKPPVLWMQAAVGALVVPYLAHAVARMAGARAGLLAGLFAALSPVQTYMLRYGVAETLTIAAANWLLAELALSVAQRRLRTLPVAASVAAAIWLRLDSVLFLIPVAMIGLWLHRPVAALARGALLACLLLLPLGLWTLRNVTVGLPVAPPAAGWMLPDGSQGPLGYQAWVKQWVITEEQRNDATWFEVDEYDRIRLAPGYARSAEEKAEVDALVERLRAASGRPFPPDIDAAFARLADERARERSGTETVTLRLVQGWGMWRDWSAPLDPKLVPSGAETWADYIAGWARNVRHGTTQAKLRAFGFAYRFTLGAAFLLVSAWAILRWRSPVQVFALGALGLVLTKSMLAVSGLFMEVRYSATAAPAIELTVALGLAALWSGLPARRAPARAGDP